MDEDTHRCACCDLANRESSLAPEHSVGWPTIAGSLLRRALSATALVWFFLSLAFTAGTICSEYTRGLLFRIAGVHLPPRTTAMLPRPGVKTVPAAHKANEIA